MKTVDPATVPAGAAVILFSAIRDGDTVQLTPDGPRVKVTQKLRQPDQDAHRLLIDGADPVTMPYDDAPEVTLFERDGFPVLDARYQVGDRVCTINYAGEDAPGVVVEVFDFDAEDGIPDGPAWKVGYDVRTSRGMVTTTSARMRLEASPEVGQLWTPIKGGRVYRVEAETPDSGGLYFELMPVTPRIRKPAAERTVLEQACESYWRGQVPDRVSTVELTSAHWRRATDDDVRAAVLAADAGFWATLGDDVAARVGKVCDCLTGPLPGVFYNPATGGAQACDGCRVFTGDLEAAAALAAKYGCVVRFHADGDPDGAEPRTYNKAAGFAGLIEDGSDPWVEPRVVDSADGWQAEQTAGAQ